MGFNYGAKQYHRVRKGILLPHHRQRGLRHLRVAATLLFPEFFIRLFTADPALTAAGEPALRLYFFGSL